MLVCLIDNYVRVGDFMRAEAGGSLGVLGQPGLQSKTLCLKTEA